MKSTTRAMNHIKSQSQTVSDEVSHAKSMLIKLEEVRASIKEAKRIDDGVRDAFTRDLNECYHKQLRDDEKTERQAILDHICLFREKEDKVLVKYYYIALDLMFFFEQSLQVPETRGRGWEAPKTLSLGSGRRRSPSRGPSRQRNGPPHPPIKGHR